MGMFLRRGKAPYLNCTITLTGTFDSKYCYATIDGVQYTSTTEMIVPGGTEVVVYVANKFSASDPRNGNVTLNDEPVTVENFGYTYTVTVPTTFTFSYKRNSGNITSSCAITTT